MKKLLLFLVSLAILPFALRASDVPGDGTDGVKAQTRPRVESYGPVKKVLNAEKARTAGVFFSVGYDF